MRAPNSHDSSIEGLALEPLVGLGRRFCLLALGLMGVLAIGVVAYAIQLREGLQVTGMAPTVNKMMWGIYIVNFVFFIGISHAGTLISAILRVAGAEWRRPITRMAEFITVVALVVGGLMPIIDLGRPDRMANLFLYGRWNSPILWDFFSIATYLVGSLIYLYLPLIPDLGLCRDRLSPRVSSPKRWFFRVFSVGWRGTAIQRGALALALSLMMILIIPVAVSVHTVVSWIFGMTLRIGWNSTVYGIYFVAGAIFSGTATLIIVMAILRRVFGLGPHIPDRQFVNLGYLLAALSLIMLYFNLSEYVTTGYKMEEGEALYLGSILVGRFAPWYWFYILGGLVLPMLLMLVPWTRNFRGVLVAAVLVDLAMWIERYIIVVATLEVPQMPYADLARYVPTRVELAITAGAFALFALLIALFTKLVPIISVWEVREGEESQDALPAAEPGRVLRGAHPPLRLGIVILALVTPAFLPGTALAHKGHERPGAPQAEAKPSAPAHPMAVERPRLVLTIPKEIRLGERMTATATLTTSGGQPVHGMLVKFLTPGAWGAIEGEMELGTVRTDAQGVARLSFSTRRSGATEILARFAGDERMAPAVVAAPITVTGGNFQLYRTGMPEVSARVTRVAPWILSAVLLAVWGAYFVVARLVLKIARAADLPAAQSAPAPVGPDAARRRLLQTLVPAGMHAAIAPVGIGLVTVVARSPYTHANLEGHQPGYHRTPYAHLGEERARTPLPPVLARQVSFSREVLPVLLAHSGPHALPPRNSPPPAGVRLSSHEHIMAKKGLVVPGKPEQSLLVEVLVNPAMRMPPSLPPLPEREIQLVVSWIAQGAANN